MLWIYFKSFTRFFRGTWWRSWLRHCTTSRKVAGSIPDLTKSLPRTARLVGSSVLQSRSNPVSPQQTVCVVTNADTCWTLCSAAQKFIFCLCLRVNLCFVLIRFQLCVCVSAVYFVYLCTSYIKFNPFQIQHLYSY
jgi:hypothetical protein